nr:PKD domain-containing protein [uncultured Desulfobacter sp.]
MRKIDSILILAAVFYHLFTIPAWASSRATLVDFGSTQAGNTFGLPGWDSVMMDVYTQNIDIGPGGTTTVVGNNGAYNYQGVAGTGRLFSPGDIIRVTWYNHSDTPVSFTPKISFNDPDRPASGSPGDWHDMETTLIGPGETGTSEFTVVSGSAGIHELVNVNVNYTNYQVLICDQIELISDSERIGVTVRKAGTGSGMVSSEPAGLDCGVVCTETLFPGQAVELTATADEGSKFSGWSGDCSGSGTCRMILDSPKTVTAQFTGGVPIAGFQVDTAIGIAPFTATFTDTSVNTPESWQWDFNNDGIIDATAQNPSFEYTEPGIYTVSLTVGNAVGSDTKTCRYLMTVRNPAGGSVYEIGPGKTYESTHDVALQWLTAGDVVRIYAKPDQAPYREKFIAAGVGTASNPIRIVGIPDDQGNKPVFYGYNALDNPNYGNYYWNENRQVILIGQYSSKPAEHLIIEGLAVHGAVYGDPYTNDSGQASTYASNACGIRVSMGTVTIRNCDIHGNENGIFSANTENLVIENCSIHDNGVHTSSTQQHNLYLGGGAGSRVTVQYSHIGELLNDGQQAKFRTETLIFRYNWVEGGKNSVLDLVEDGDNGVSDAYVYGNVLIKPAYANNGRMIHFGGDNAAIHRTGTLYFFNNTCIIKTVNRQVVLFQITETGADVIADNNIFYKPAGISLPLYLCDPYREDNLTGENNWLRDSILGAELLSSSLLGETPGFIDAGNDDYHLADAAPVKDIIQGDLFPGGYVPDKQYVKHLAFESRPDDGRLDIGAFELAGPPCPADLEPDGRIDAGDMVLLAGDFGLPGEAADIDGDGDMDGRDLYEMAENFNTDCTP